MSDLSIIRRHLTMEAGWFTHPGVYALVDGQFGSTGKGLVAGLFAEMFYGRVRWNLTNNGPNAGHTSYYKDEKIVLKQLPTFGVIERKIQDNRFYKSNIGLTNGAIIDRNILASEIMTYMGPNEGPFVSENVAWVFPDHKEKDKGTVASIASTGQGTGPALIEKLGRNTKLSADRPGFFNYGWQQEIIFLEVGQGFSLGINSGIYPYVTSRECTVAQGLSDASLPPSSVRGVVMVVRTYPIRVGSVPGAPSGPGYPDQEEIDWPAIGVEPELTTVTKRPRRIFTWSAMQFEHALLANAPNVIFVNFCNYLKPGTVDDWVMNNVYTPYIRVMGKEPAAILLGYGPKSGDVMLWK